MRGISPLKTIRRPDKNRLFEKKEEGNFDDL